MKTTDVSKAKDMRELAEKDGIEPRCECVYILGVLDVTDIEPEREYLYRSEDDREIGYYSIKGGNNPHLVFAFYEDKEHMVDWDFHTGESVWAYHNRKLKEVMLGMGRSGALPFDDDIPF